MRRERLGGAGGWVVEPRCWTEPFSVLAISHLPLACVLDAGCWMKEETYPTPFSSLTSNNAPSSISRSPLVVVLCCCCRNVSMLGRIVCKHR